jgi:3-oxoacyl-[acyl-carrier protein] reductase
MSLKFKNKLFIVCGAGSGFGRAIAEQLLAAGARVIGIARTAEVMLDFEQQHQGLLMPVIGDITTEDIQEKVMLMCSNQAPAGVVVNAGGPPAMSFMESKLDDWDKAWHSLVRWKVSFVKKVIPAMQKRPYGRLLFIESVSVKQPVENLVLSNSLRMAVVGFVKTLSRELASQNITMNILAPGYHNTAAVKRVFQKKAANEGITYEEAKSRFEKHIPVGSMGEAAELAELALWLLSPGSRYVTGQTISHDGGAVQGVFG